MLALDTLLESLPQFSRTPFAGSREQLQNFLLSRFGQDAREACLPDGQIVHECLRLYRGEQPVLYLPFELVRRIRLEFLPEGISSREFFLERSLPAVKKLFCKEENFFILEGESFLLKKLEFSDFPWLRSGGSLRMFEGEDSCLVKFSFPGSEDMRSANDVALTHLSMDAGLSIEAGLPFSFGLSVTLDIQRMKFGIKRYTLEDVERRWRESKEAMSEIWPYVLSASPPKAILEGESEALWSDRDSEELLQMEQELLALRALEEVIESRKRVKKEQMERFIKLHKGKPPLTFYRLSRLLCPDRVAMEQMSKLRPDLYSSCVFPDRKPDPALMEAALRARGVNEDEWMKKSINVDIKAFSKACEALGLKNVIGKKMNFSVASSSDVVKEFVNRASSEAHKAGNQVLKSILHAGKKTN